MWLEIRCLPLSVSMYFFFVEQYVFKWLPCSQQETGDREDIQDLPSWESLGFLILSLFVWLLIENFDLYLLPNLLTTLGLPIDSQSQAMWPCLDVNHLSLLLGSQAVGEPDYLLVHNILTLLVQCPVGMILWLLDDDSMTNMMIWYADHKMIISCLVFRATPLPSVNVTAGMLGLRTHLDHS